MTITRVGTNEKYASNWDVVFGGKKKASSGKAAAPTKSAVAKAAPAKKSAKKTTKAVKKAAQKWGLKSTTGIDAHLKDTTHTAVDESVCEECYEEGAKPDFLDLDKDGNKAEPMKKAASDAKNKKHHDKLKEIIQKAKNI